MTSSKDYTDKVCIVTGSNSGIGACTVKKLAEHGAKVVVTGRDAVRIAQVADECKQLSPNGYEPLQVVCDLTKSDDIRRLVQSTIDRFEKIDLVAANAGVFSSALIDNPKLVETFDFTMLTNVRPVLRLLQLCVPYLEQSKGAIVVTSSMLSFKPIAIYMPYCMSKAALDIMTKCLAIDLGPKGIRVNSVNPAIVSDNFIARSLGLDFDQMAIELGKAGQSYPLGRLATVEDIANLILFLGSQDAAFITGQNICPDGGSTYAGDSDKPRPQAEWHTYLNNCFLTYTGELKFMRKMLSLCDIVNEHKPSLTKMCSRVAHKQSSIIKIIELFPISKFTVDVFQRVTKSDDSEHF